MFLDARAVGAGGRDRIKQIQRGDGVKMEELLEELTECLADLQVVPEASQYCVPFASFTRLTRGRLFCGI